MFSRRRETPKHGLSTILSTILGGRAHPSNKAIHCKYSPHEIIGFSWTYSSLGFELHPPLTNQQLAACLGNEVNCAVDQEITRRSENGILRGKRQKSCRRAR